MSHDLRLIGPIYAMDDGTKLQDLDGACPHCYKRLAEVIFDPGMTWNAGWIICLNCGVRVAAPQRKQQRKQNPVVLRPSWRASGLRVASCTLCPRYSMPLTLPEAAAWAAKHLREAHPDVA